VEDRSTERAIELSKVLAELRRKDRGRTVIGNETRPNSTTEEVVRELRSRAAFVMVSHVKPDGDTLGAGWRSASPYARLGSASITSSKIGAAEPALSSGFR